MGGGLSLKNAWLTTFFFLDSKLKLIIITYCYFCFAMYFSALNFYKRIVQQDKIKNYAKPTGVNYSSKRESYIKSIHCCYAKELLVESATPLYPEQQQNGMVEGEFRVIFLPGQEHCLGTEDILLGVFLRWTSIPLVGGGVGML